MGIEFGFAVVPFERAGYLMDLYTEKGGDALKKGVIRLKTKGEEKLTPYLGFNWASFRAVNEITEGVFIA